MKTQNFYWRFCFYCFLGVGFSLNAFYSFAEENKTEQVIQRQLNQDRFPWFSSKDQSLHFLPPPEISDQKKRNENAEKDEKPGLILWLFWGGVTLLVVVLSLFVFWAIFKLLWEKRLKLLPAENDENQQRRLDALVPEVQDHIHDLLKAATEAIDKEDYKKAIIFYFSYLLIKLDEYHYIRLHRGKTNFDYAIEIPAQTEMSGVYSQVSNLFDKTYYGNFPILWTDFAEIWQLRDRFQELLLTDPIFSSSKTKNDAVSTTIIETEIAEAEIVEADAVASEPIRIKIDESEIIKAKIAETEIVHKTNSSESEKSDTQSLENVREEPLGNLSKENVNPSHSKIHSNERETGVFNNLWIFFLVSLLTLTGCQKVWKEKYSEILPRSYQEQSITGDSLFRSVCKAQGSQTKYKWRVPATLDDYDCVVWYANFNLFQESLDENALLLPDQNSCDQNSCDSQQDNSEQFTYIDFYENWLKAKPGRTLILVDSMSLSDYDFWNEMLLHTPKEHESWVKEKIKISEQQIFGFWLEQIKAQKKLQNSENFKNPNEPSVSENYSNKNPVDFFDQITNDPLTDQKDNEISRNLASSSRSWFQLEFFSEIKKTRGLSGDKFWSNDLSPDYSHSFVYQVIPGKEMEVLLTAENIPFLSRKKVGESQVLLFSSFHPFLNYYLLKKDNQILIERLMKQIQNPKRILLIEECGGFPQAKVQYGEPYFSLWKYSPFAVLAWHLIFVILILCFAIFPVLGRPKEIPETQMNDFSKHIEAYGRMIQETNQSQWAAQQIERFQNNREH